MRRMTDGPDAPIQVVDSPPTQCGGLVSQKSNAGNLDFALLAVTVQQSIAP